MSFATEMLVSASRNRLRIKEIPVSHHKRIGETKLNPIREGVKILSLMLRLKYSGKI
jgi:hypothetical protein